MLHALAVFWLEKKKEIIITLGDMISIFFLNKSSLNSFWPFFKKKVKMNDSTLTTSWKFDFIFLILSMYLRLLIEILN